MLTEEHRMNRESRGKAWYPYLAKNERDMGHPSLVREPEADACGAEFVSGALCRMCQCRG